MTGGCLCGAVRFTARLVADDLQACHCGQCRRWSGYVWAGISAQLSIGRGDGLRWFRSSDHARRGFCGQCGSSLFWQQDGASVTEIAAGAFDHPDALRLVGHIHTAGRPAYDQITDGLPQYPAEAPQ